MFYQATALTCWDNTLRTLWSCIVFIYTYTCKRTHAHRHTHRCRRATCSALRRFFGEISQNSRCILVLKNNKRRKKKEKTSVRLLIHLLFSRVFFFFFFCFFLGDYRSANKQRLLNVYSVMLLYIVYYGPRQLGNQAYFKWGGGNGEGGPFSSITTIKTINLLQPGIPQFRWTVLKKNQSLSPWSWSSLALPLQPFGPSSINKA